METRSRNTLIIIIIIIIIRRSAALPVWQVVPVKPVGQMQLKVFPVVVHVPPFWQVTVEQAVFVRTEITVQMFGEGGGGEGENVYGTNRVCLPSPLPPPPPQ